MEITYNPKGSMCMACAKKEQDCSLLPFSQMPVLENHDEIKIVKCLGFLKEKQ